MGPQIVDTKEAPRSIDLLCHQGAKMVRFDKIGVPTSEWPVDVALTHDSIWVLFMGGRLMHLGRRSDDRLDVRMHFLMADQGWEKMDVDPLDGSVWVVSLSSLDLYRVSPQGQVTTVKLQKKIEGQGGFAGLRVARDAIYAQPTCAESAIWRLDRAGKFLGTAFKVPERPANEEQPRVATVNSRPETLCYSLRLERDADGRILAWDREKKEAWQVDEEGNWARSDSRLFSYLREPGDALTITGVDIGKQTEQWYFAGASGDLFYWKGQPIFMGGMTNKEKSPGSDTVLYVPGKDGPEEVLMTCYGLPILDAASDATTYAALTQHFLVVGDVASAPDLPSPQSR